MRSINKAILVLTVKDGNLSSTSSAGLMMVFVSVMTKMTRAGGQIKGGY